jgi:hypothetical protein
MIWKNFIPLHVDDNEAMQKECSMNKNHWVIMD